MTPPPRVVLDASAALEWILARKHKLVIAKLLPVAVLPSSALTEALYNAVLAGHALDPQSLHDALLVAGVRIEPITAEDSVRAAELISSTRLAKPAAGSLSLGDGLCIAVAERLNLTVAGGDQFWETLDLRVSYTPYN